MTPIRLRHFGKLVNDCATPGERRADGIAPAHPNGIPLSKNTFLLLVSTLNFRGVDDNAGIVGQLRKGGFDGPVIREIPLARSAVDWDLFGDGELHVRQYGHPVAFGLPKGALINGKPALHANHFAVLWRCCARKISPGGWLYWRNEPEAVTNRSQHVRWCQFRLNDTEDDLEFLTESEPLRQTGREKGDGLPADRLMNQTFVQPVRFNPAADEWVVCNHLLRPDGRRTTSLAILKFRFNPAIARYEWVEASREFGEGYFEASVLPFKGDWIILARNTGAENRRQSAPTSQPAWARVHDLFAEEIRLQPIAEKGCVWTPVSAYACPDGKVRWLSGNIASSPYGLGRNPLYLHEADPEDGFSTKASFVVFDAIKAGLPIQPSPIVDMGKLLPHSGGREQILAHRVRTVALRSAEADMGGPALVLTEGDFQSTAIYSARVDYGEDLPGEWAF